VASLPDRQSDLPGPGGQRGPAGDGREEDPAQRLSGLPARVAALDRRLLFGLALGLAGAIALALALDARVRGVGAVPAVLRTAIVTIALFGLCGFAAARFLVRGELAAHRPLMVLPLGAAISALSLAVLGLIHVPLKVSLAVVLAAAALASVLAWRRGNPDGATPPRTRSSLLTRIVLPLALAGIVGLVSLIPVFRSGFATVPGQNGDAVLVVGTAVLLEHAPPTATRTDLPINRIPLEWRSKYPIYYPLAAVSTLAGQDPIAAFATVVALMLAITSLGWFLFARYLLRAPPWVALLVAAVLPLDRIVMYVTVHPYYNELWGQFTLPLILLFGWSYLREPNRLTGLLFALFVVLGLLAYPLMVPFPALFLITYGWVVWRRRRAAGERTRWISALRLPRPRQRPWLWLPVVAVAIPVVVVLGRGFVEKTSSALKVLAPGTDLSAWHGNALGYIPFPRFVGMPGSQWIDFVGLAAICVLAVVGLRYVRPEVRVPIAVMAVLTALIGIYFRIRTDGELFFFKDLAFLGPYLLMLALVALAAIASSPRAGRASLGVAGLAAAVGVVVASGAREINSTFDNATPSVMELRSWDRQLPAGRSVRLDIPQSGQQLWVTYMFLHHPLSALNPLGGIFPHPPVGRKADYVIALRTQPRPADAVGEPLLRSAQYQLWRMNPAVPGPDISTRREIYDLTSISIT
jgi:hypothetical protein